jgi:hypothetical protein
MWGGLAQLGNHLGEAIQRAKTQLDKLDGPGFGYEENDEQKPASDGGDVDEDDDFAVDAGGLFIATGIVYVIQSLCRRRVIMLILCLCPRACSEEGICNHPTAAAGELGSGGCNRAVVVAI